MKIYNEKLRFELLPFTLISTAIKKKKKESLGSM